MTRHFLLRCLVVGISRFDRRGSSAEPLLRYVKITVKVGKAGQMISGC